MKKLLLTGILTICFLIGTIVPGGIAAEKPQPKVRIGFLATTTANIIYVTYLNGWKAEGLDVELKQFQGGPAIVEAMMAGAIDAAAFGYVPMLNAATRGLPLYYLVSEGVATKDYPMFMVTVRPDSTMKSFTDLKGKTIALHMRGTPEDLLLSAACEKYGMNKSDLKITLVPWPQQGGVLAHNQVDATFPYPPFEALQEFNKQGKVLWAASEVMAYTPVSALAVTRKFADANPEATQKIAKAFIKAGRWADDNRAEIKTKLLTAKEYYLGLQPEIAQLTHLPYWPRNGFHLMPAIWSLYQMMVKTNMIKPWDNPEAKMREYFIDPTMKYTVPAVKELGMSQDAYTDKLLTTSLPYLDKKPESYFGPWQK